MSSDKLLKVPSKGDLISPRPFLRWAGGKTWLIKHLMIKYPDISFRNYHEPFVGGAATFFYFNPQCRAYLSDLNFELIETYKAIKDDVESVIKELRCFSNTKEEYYRIREAKYRNSSRKAARFIFLNQTSFNGIYRVNLEGNYNVPYGFRKKDFFEPDNLRLVSKSLKNCSIFHGDFDRIRKNVKAKDLVFLDPPYTVTHNNNGFIKYNQKLFSLEDQYRLSRLLDFINSSGAFYILTNAAHEKVEEIFEKGHNKIHLERASLIGGNHANRGYYSEVLFTNL